MNEDSICKTLKKEEKYKQRKPKMQNKRNKNYQLVCGKQIMTFIVARDENDLIDLWFV